MSLECGECERDLRGPHAPSCSHYKPPARCRICSEKLVEDDFGLYCPTHGASSAEADPYAALSQHLHGDGDAPRAKANELLPCPFCGGTSMQHYTSTRYESEYIMCPCGCDLCGGPAKWNTRFSPAVPTCTTPGCTNPPVIRLDDRHLCRGCYATPDFGDDA